MKHVSCSVNFELLIIVKSSVKSGRVIEQAGNYRQFCMHLYCNYLFYS